MKIDPRHTISQFNFSGFYILTPLRKFHPRNFTTLRHTIITKMNSQGFTY